MKLLLYIKEESHKYTSFTVKIGEKIQLLGDEDGWFKTDYYNGAEIRVSFFYCPWSMFLPITASSEGPFFISNLHVYDDSD